MWNKLFCKTTYEASLLWDYLNTRYVTWQLLSWFDIAPKAVTQVAELTYFMKIDEHDIMLSEIDNNCYYELQNVKFTIVRKIIVWNKIL